MDVIGHDHPCVQGIVFERGATLDRSQDELSNGRLSEEGRTPAGLIEQSVHGDEGFAGG